MSGLGLSALITDLSFSNLDRVNPPVNVTAEIERTCLTIQWKKPVSPFPIHCFVYEVKIYNTRKGFSQVILHLILTFDDRLLPETLKKLSPVTALVTAWNQQGQRKLTSTQV